MEGYRLDVGDKVRRGGAGRHGCPRRVVLGHERRQLSDAGLSKGMEVKASTMEVTEKKWR